MTGAFAALAPGARWRVWESTDGVPRRRPTDSGFAIVDDAPWPPESGMLTHTSHKPHRSDVEVPDDPEPGSLPVDPDEGPMLPIIPDDPPDERFVHPQA